MKKARLMRLVKLLRKDASNKDGIRFNLTTWARPSARSRRWHKAPADPIPVNCGTTACAMGLAALSGEFKKEGLFAAYIKEGNEVSLVPELGSKDPGIDNSHGFSAAARLFGIRYDVADWLFSPSYYQSRQRKGAKGERAVADRIAKFVRDGGLPRNKKTGKRYSVSEWKWRYSVSEWNWR